MHIQHVQMSSSLTADQRAGKVVYIHSIPGFTVGYRSDLWERDNCVSLGQLYGMSIWSGGWVVAGPDNVRAAREITGVLNSSKWKH